MPKKAKQKGPMDTLLGWGMAREAAKTIKGRKKKLEQAEKAATGDSWGSGVKRNK